MELHGIEVFFCSHKRCSPAVLPPSQRCDGHEGLGGCSQQGQQDHRECNTHTHTHTHKRVMSYSVILLVKCAVGKRLNLRLLIGDLFQEAAVCGGVTETSLVRSWCQCQHVAHSQTPSPQALVNEETNVQEHKR